MTKTTKQEHTKLPWKVNNGFKNLTITTEEDGLYIAESEGRIGNSDLDLANAQFIVKACNNHYKLLEACKQTRYALMRGVIGIHEVNLLDQTIKECEG